VETQTKNIDGEEWELSQLTAFRGLRLLTRIGAAAGPALSKLGAMMSGGEIDLALAGELIEGLFQKLNEDEITHFVKEMLFGGGLKMNNVLVEKPFDTLMAGKTMTIFKLLFWGFEVNYGDFFAAAKGWVKPTAAKASPSPGSTT
jgi:hypothetical protein